MNPEPVIRSIGPLHHRGHGKFLFIAAIYTNFERAAKLPEVACVPSGEIASPRTGPPWPRNCACGAAERQRQH